MLRRSMMAVLVVAALACIARDAQAGNPCCRQKVLEYLFGGYGPGPFGKGEFSYAGQYPIDNRTCRGCKIQ